MFINGRQPYSNMNNIERKNNNMDMVFLDFEVRPSVQDYPWLRDVNEMQNNVQCRRRKYVPQASIMFLHEQCNV